MDEKQQPEAEQHEKPHLDQEELTDLDVPKEESAQVTGGYQDGEDKTP